ncbi:MAG TPA: O-acetyl-ADP-ribose deacetylase [Spirochaetia bacterium]|nr:O-acetyl-ADP-ribose deacetylase [Spirochaetia bacterium]
MGETQWFKDGRLGVKTGDITEEKVDAIVNAANSSLMGGGGVDGAIHMRGGPAILDECRAIRREKYPKGLPAGKAVVTGAGNLPSRYVIHTVGPVWGDGKSGEHELLASAYLESMKRARELEADTVAFPAISTGVYGYPKKQAAQVAFNTLARFLEENDFPRKVVLVFFSGSDARAFMEATSLSHQA